MTDAAHGRYSETHFKTLAKSPTLHLIEAKPLSGRTHQIRVHLQALHAPILGDPIYGNQTINKKFSHTRLQLHAYKLHFQHPITEKAMTLFAPIPHDMLQFVNQHFPGLTDESTFTESFKSESNC
jgi:23S rRNA-/tRNA-specific pseudouridylate synthase